jgi:uncharacterized membrane protein YagU involved in acid resistance
MTVAQKVGEQLQSSSQDGAGDPADPWADAPAPARVVRRIGEDILGVEVSADSIPLLTHVVHWGYGVSWGGLYGLASRRARSRGQTFRRGIEFGFIVWAMSYAQLVPLGIYEPPWRYPASELAGDISYHLVYGLGTAAALDL